MRENDLGYTLASVLKKVKGEFACSLSDRVQVFESVEEFMNSDFEKRCELLSIRAKNGMVVLELEKLPPTNDLNASWVQEHIKKYGHEPSFFDC